MPKTTIPEKWLQQATNHLTSRFEILPPTSSVGAEDNEREIKSRAQRDSNPRPTAPQAAILSKLNYGPTVHLTITRCRRRLLGRRHRNSNISFFYIPQLKPRCTCGHIQRDTPTYIQLACSLDSGISINALFKRP
jgi:hypothetical protein